MESISSLLRLFHWFVFLVEGFTHLSELESTCILATENNGEIQKYDSPLESNSLVGCVGQWWGRTVLLNSDTVREVACYQVLHKAQLFPRHNDFQHDGAPRHISRLAFSLLDELFPNSKIGRYTPAFWPAPCPYLKPLETLSQASWSLKCSGFLCQT